MEGAITARGHQRLLRAGTHPLVQTGQLDTGALLINKELLTPLLTSIRWPRLPTRCGW